MGQLADMSNGVHLALNATLARLNGEDVQPLLNASTGEELAHAVAFLADAYQDVLVALLGDDRARAIELVEARIAGGGATDDIMAAQLRAMERGGDDL